MGITTNKKIGLFLVASVFSVFSQVITLQPGLNGYNGFVDSYIVHADQDIVFDEDTINAYNFGGADSIVTNICKA